MSGSIPVASGEMGNVQGWSLVRQSRPERVLLSLDVGESDDDFRARLRAGQRHKSSPLGRAHLFINEGRKEKKSQ